MTPRHPTAQHTLKLVALSPLLLSLLASCQVVSLLFGVTIAQRVQDFSNGYTSGDYSTLYKQFSSSTQERPVMKGGSYWEGTPFASTNDPKPLAGYNVDGSTVTGTFMNNNGTFALTMRMEKVGIDWYIKSIRLSRKFVGDQSRAEIRRIR